MNENQLKMAIAAYTAAVAQANGLQVNQVAQSFSVVPAAVQAMYDEIALSSNMLQKINLIPKKEKLGEVIGLQTGLVGSTTDTSNPSNRREPTRIHTLSKRNYALEKINFDVALRYEEMDGWAHLTDFPARVNKKIAESIALSLITIGINGEGRADNSDKNANPLLQDVAKGWLQKIREENPERVLGWETGHVGTTKKEVEYGVGASEYKNLDAIVVDCLNELIDERFADRTDFVVLASRRTVGDKYLRIINQSADTATELESGGRLNKERTLGGLSVLHVPHFPVDTLLITPLKNLSIYYQMSGERRHVIDRPEQDQLESYQSKNLDFVVEEYGAVALVENLKHVG